MIVQLSFRSEQDPQSRPHVLSVFYGSWNIVGVKQTCSLKFNHGGKLDGELFSRVAPAAGKINPFPEASPSGISWPLHPQWQREAFCCREPCYKSEPWGGY